MKSPTRRVVVIVLDGVGAGAAPDAVHYGDAGANSLGNAAKAVGGIKTPNLAAIGLGCLTEIQGVQASATSPCAYGGCSRNRRARTRFPAIGS